MCLFLGRQPPLGGQCLLIHEVSRSPTTTQHIRQESSRRVISSSQRSPPDNTQHSKQTSMTSVGRSHNLSRRVAADLRRRPRGYWDRYNTACCKLLSSEQYFKQGRSHQSDSIKVWTKGKLGFGCRGGGLFVFGTSAQTWPWVSHSLL